MNKKLKNQKSVKKALNMKAVALLASCGVLVGSSVASAVSVYNLADDKIEIYNNFRDENEEFASFVNYEKQKYTEKVKNGELSPETYNFFVSELQSDKKVQNSFDKYATNEEKKNLRRVNTEIVGSTIITASGILGAAGLYSTLENKAGKLFVDKKTKEEDEKEYF